MAVENLRSIVQDWVKSGEIAQIQWLKDMINTLSPADKEEMLNIIEVAESDANEDAKIALGSLKESLEVSMETVQYSMEWLWNLNNSEFFELFFEASSFTEWYPYWVSWKIENLPHLKNYQDTIELTLWKHIIGKISLGWIAGSASSMITWTIRSAFSSSEETESSEENRQWWFAQIAEIIWNLKEITDRWEQPELKDLEKIMKFMDVISKDYFTRLTEINNLIENSPLSEDQIALVVDNPYIISELTKNGTYTGNGFDINLSTWKLEIWESSESSQEIKSSFLKEVSAITNEKWNVIENLREKVDQIAWSLYKMWFKKETLISFWAGLAKFPVFWVLLKGLFDYFFKNGGVFNRLDELHLDDTIQNSLQNLKKLNQNINNIDDLPWLIAEGEEKNIWGEHKAHAVVFLKKVDKVEDELNIENTEISNANFWEDVFKKEDPADMSDTMKYIRTATVELRWNTKLDRDVFFKKLKTVEIVIPGSVTPEESTSTAPSDTLANQNTAQINEPTVNVATPAVATTAAATLTPAPVDSELAWVPDPLEQLAWQEIAPIDQEEVVEAPLPSLESQIDSIQSLPATLVLENWEEVIVDISNNNSWIIINNEAYSISMMVSVLGVNINIFENISFENGLKIEHKTSEDENWIVNIDSKKLSEIILSISESWSFTEIKTKDWNEVKIEISQVWNQNS